MAPRPSLKAIKRPKCQCPDNRCCNWFKNKENLQVFLTIMSVIIGVVVGLSMKMSGVEFSAKTIAIIGFPGEMLMNMLKMLIIPLIVCSLISGLANLDTKSSGKIGTYALAYYGLTTLFAVILGIILVVSIHPGDESIKSGMIVQNEKLNKRNADTLDAFMDLFRNLFPENIVQATLQQKSTSFENATKRYKEIKADGKEVSRDKTVTILKSTYLNSTNVLGLVTFSIAFGLCISVMGEKGRPMLQFFTIFNEIIMRLVGLIMWYAPFGIMFLICAKILTMDNLAKVAKGLGMYMATVILGLVIHLMFTLCLMYFLVTRKNPLRFLHGVARAFITAIGIGSSAATLPITFQCLEENLKIDPRVTRFVLPIGATVNMDGTALYEAVASIFIAQVNAVNLSIGQLITVSFTATLAAIGAASVPSAGLVTMMLVLTSVNLPTDDITLILAVDWLLDRIRTSINVMGDAFGAGIVAHLTRHDLYKLTHPDEVDLDQQDQDQQESANLNAPAIDQKDEISPL